MAPAWGAVIIDGPHAGLVCEAYPSHAGLTPVVRERRQTGSSMDDLERAYDDAKYGGNSRRRFIAPVVPTFVDGLRS